MEITKPSAHGNDGMRDQVETQLRQYPRFGLVMPQRQTVLAKQMRVCWPELPIAKMRVCVDDEQN